MSPFPEVNRFKHFIGISAAFNQNQEQPGREASGALFPAARALEQLKEVTGNGRCKWAGSKNQKGRL